VLLGSRHGGLQPLSSPKSPSVLGATDGVVSSAFYSGSAVVAWVAPRRSLCPPSKLIPGASSRSHWGG